MKVDEINNFSRVTTERNSGYCRWPASQGRAQPGRLPHDNLVQHVESTVLFSGTDVAGASKKKIKPFFDPWPNLGNGPTTGGVPCKR